MHRILKNIVIPVSQEIFIKDPISSALGKRILSESLVLIELRGIEAFNFKLLSIHVECTEAAIYRYFENKNKLLLYYINWYWGWLEHNLVYSISNLESPAEKIKMAITLLVEGPIYKENFYLNISSLKKVVLEESNKSFMSKEVKCKAKSKLLHQFYDFSERLKDLILLNNPDYPFPKVLVSTLIWSTILNGFSQLYGADLIEENFNEQNKVDFYYNMVFNSLKR
ncbi:TetR/AcrR family transcriptional regulator [uncultured Cyclobacterium sp.]|uniref:TetR/AcrR family transcriptional regulator n=1 Tax=uncultured Cyclobacterium sp. TaxID=453820 RepID=UPI0030EBF61A